MRKRITARTADERMRKVRDALLCMQREAWEQGLAAQAMMESGEEELAVLLAHDAVVRQAPDGRLAAIGECRTVTDPAAAGEAVLFAAARTGDPAFRSAAERMAQWLLTTPHRTADGVLHHFIDAPYVWVDSLYMAPPFLAAAGHHAEAVRQVEGMRKILWDPQARLYHHMWDDGEKRFTRAAFWGSGNGWAAAGLARVIGHLPAAMEADRERLGGFLRELVDGCVARMRPDGLFHDVMDDPGTFVETNASQMIACAIYRGVALECLEESALVHADRMRDAAHRMVDERGLVRGVCGSPGFDRPGTSTEGQAFFLLMEAARELCAGRRRQRGARSLRRARF
jgi:unsaturated rhamnogalacturonyl hydrolase